MSMLQRLASSVQTCLQPGIHEMAALSSIAPVLYQEHNADVLPAILLSQLLPALATVAKSGYQ